MTKNIVGIIGARSLVGQQLLSSLSYQKWQIKAFTRTKCDASNEYIQWCTYPNVNNVDKLKLPTITVWISVAPIWLLAEYFDLLLAYKIKNIVVLSSTSRFTKLNSTNKAELNLAQKYIDGEENIQNWATQNNISLTILRTTMIYGHGQDKNITEISRFIYRWSFFPILGQGSGLRQPIHVDDLVKFCCILINKTPKNTIYTISGGEILSYIEMITRIFAALGKKPRFIYVPRWLFGIATYGLSFFTRFKHWNVSMADRMDSDLTFDHNEAKLEFDFSPQLFSIKKSDLAK